MDEHDDSLQLEEHDFVPHFQRVSISGEDTSGVRIFESLCLIKIIGLSHTCEYIANPLQRETYMSLP